MLVTSIQFGLFCIYPCLIFSLSFIYACYFYSIWLFFIYPILIILHLSFSFFYFFSPLFLFLLSNLAYFAFIFALFLGGQLSILVTSIQFGLFCIYPCLIFRRSVIYACYFYPIWLILHLSLPYF